MNSISTFLSAETLANEIMMQRGGYHGSLLLVEGDRDHRLFRKLVNSESCMITICFNKENILSVVDLLMGRNCNGFLGVVDADFDILRGITYRQNLLCTDYNDIEVMLIMSKAFDEFLTEFASDEKLANFEKNCGWTLREYLIGSAAYIGALRFLSQENGWNLSFNETRYLFKRDPYAQFDFTRTVKRIVASSRFNTIAPEEVIQCASDLTKSHAQLDQLCCGYDLGALVSQLISRCIGSVNDFSNESGLIRFWSIIRLSYSRDHFITTKLYKDIKSWESANSTYIVLNY